MSKIDNFCFLALAFLLAIGCESNNIEELIDCSQSSLTISVESRTDASSCTASDGSFKVIAQGGSDEYTFSLDATSNMSGTFEGLSAGTYQVIVRDKASCEVSTEVEIKATGSTLSATSSVTPDTGCTTHNGVISLSVTAGATPYEFKLNSGAFSGNQNFSELDEGKYTVTVRDAEGCILTLALNVPKGPSGISYNDVIKPILDTKCSIPSCHNGDLGASRNWTVLSTVLASAKNIKARTESRNMPPSGSLTQEQIDLIGCWADGL